MSEKIDFSKLSLESLREIYAASFGICMGFSAPEPLRRSLEYQRNAGKVKMPQSPSKRLLTELA